MRLRWSVLLLMCLVVAPVAVSAGTGPGPGTATPWIGVAIEEAPAAGKPGVLVKRALPDTPAAKAGLQPGDLIVRADGKPFTAPGPFIGYIQGRGVGASIELDLERAGAAVTVTLVLVARPDELERLRTLVVGKPAGELGLMTAAGPPLVPSSLAGKVVVVEFMATWCGACRSASTTLDGWEKKYGDRGLKVIAVSNEDPALLAKYHQALGAHYTLATDPKGALGSRFEVPAYPTFVVIDRTGTVRGVDIGAGLVLDSVEATFVHLLEAPAPAPVKKQLTKKAKRPKK